MEIIDLHGQKEFSATRITSTRLHATPHSDAPPHAGVRDDGASKYAFDVQWYTHFADSTGS